MGGLAAELDLDMKQTDAVAEIGYTLAKPHWGKGLMLEAVARGRRLGVRVVGFGQGLRDG